MATRDLAFKSTKKLLDRIIKFKIEEINNKSFDEKMRNLDTHNMYLFAKYLYRKKSAMPPLEDSDKSLAYSDLDKANTLANALNGFHLTTHAWPSANEHAVQTSIQVVDRAKISIPDSQLIKNDQVDEIIKQHKMRKASGPDKIPNSIIQALPASAVVLLTAIYNVCLRTSYFP